MTQRGVVAGAWLATMNAEGRIYLRHMQEVQAAKELVLSRAGELRIWDPEEFRSTSKKCRLAISISKSDKTYQASLLSLFCHLARHVLM